MSQSERSLLFYILDALRGRPDKARCVLNLVEHDEISVDFIRHIRTLQAADESREAVLAAVSEVRRQII